MTITTTTLRAQYNGNGATTAFSVPFEFLEAEGVKVIYTDADGVDTTWVKDTHYTLTNNTAAATGTVNVKTAPTDYTPATGTMITIIRNQPFKQTTSYVNNDPFPAKSHEKALDRLTMEVQTLAEQVGRAPKVPETSTIEAAEFPRPSADKVIGWNSDATALENKALTDLQDGLYEVIDEDDMASDSDTKVPTQQSVKAYADAILTERAFDQAETGNFWSDDLTPARIHRITDRVLIGGATEYDGKRTSPAYSWLGQANDEMSNGTFQPNLGWIERNAQAISYTAGQGALGGAFAARTSQFTTGGAGVFGIGLVAVVVNDRRSTDTGGTAAAQALYLDSKRYDDAGTTWGAEFEIANHGSYVPRTASGSTSGATILLTLGAGADSTINGTTEDASVAMEITTNGAKFGRGIVAQHLALRSHTDIEAGSVTHRIAMEMGQHHSLRWVNTSDDVTGWIRCGNTTGANALGISLEDNVVEIRKVDGKKNFRFLSEASAVNGIELRAKAATNSVTLAAFGDDTNISFNYTAKGTGSHVFSGNVSTNGVYQRSGSQVVSARKTGWATATGTATRTTFATTTVTLSELAERVKALIDDLHASSSGHGLIGT